MARRTKLEKLGIGILVVIGLCVSAIQNFFEAFGFIMPCLIIAGSLIGYLIYGSHKKKKKQQALSQRKYMLMERYGNEELVDNILNQVIWVGETDEQLRESLGEPEDIDQKVLKTKKKEVWKYGHKGGNRYKFRITLDNDVIVGWDEKA